MINLTRVIAIMESTPNLFDGLVIEGGRGDLQGTFANQDATGGGVLANGEITFRNCIIRRNVARNRKGLSSTNVCNVLFDTLTEILQQACRIGKYRLSVL